jgi:hypothetical protein
MPRDAPDIATLHDAAARAARALTAAQLDTYEAAARALWGVQWLLARSALYEPLGMVVRAWADMTRDTIAVQLSMARWLLEL